VSVNYRRQLGFYDPNEHKSDRVSIIGLGGIGSFTSFGIAKLGVPNITIMDDDTVEDHNVPNQFHSLEQVGWGKAEASASTLMEYAGADTNWLTGRITKDGFNGEGEWNPRGLVISGVDSMSSRKDIWRNGNIKHNHRVKQYIDARIAGQLIVIYSVNPMDADDVSSYEKTLHSDGEAVAAPCTERGVIDVGLAVAAILTNMTRKFLTGEGIASVTTMNMDGLVLGHGDWIL